MWNGAAAAGATHRCPMSSSSTIARGALRAGLAVALLASAASAQDATSPAHGAHGSAMAGASDEAAEVAGEPTAASRAFDEVNARMHRDMAIALSGDPDRDFAEMMIAHHQGAIDMAKVVIDHGRDPEIRALAEEVVEAQEREVAFLRGWLARGPAGAAEGAAPSE